ncbi:MAG: outer membrane lipoprotein-sorting protein [Armatimonadetes bacterium]|nr:outer membrane lipoprotein-sorting protein [Armatimonadota bacterium]
MTRIISLAVLLTASVAGAGQTDHITKLKNSLPTFKDICFAAEVVEKDKRVLNKMDKRLSLSYEFSKARVWFRVPYSTRIDGTLGMVKAQLTTTDKLSILRIPSVRYSKKEDISQDPAKKQTALDLGVLTPQFFKDYEVKLLPEDETRPGLLVLELRQSDPGSSIRTLWVDPERLRVVRMEKRRPDGRLVAAYMYLKYEKFNGKLWVPSRVELHGEDDKLAAALELKDIKVDTDIPDSMFE